MTIRMIDATRIWADPPKGHDAADALAEGLERQVEAAIVKRALVGPPQEEQRFCDGVEEYIFSKSGARGHMFVHPCGKKCLAFWLADKVISRARFETAKAALESVEAKGWELERSVEPKRKDVRVLWHETSKGVMAWVFLARQFAIKYEAEHKRALNGKLDSDRIRLVEKVLPAAGQQEVSESDLQAPEDAPDDKKSPWDMHIDMGRVFENWRLGETGVVPVMQKTDKSGAQYTEPSWNSRVTDRPIWPRFIGRDLATDGLFVDVAWRDPMGRIRSQWLDDQDVRKASSLIDLPASPVTDGRHRRCAEWITFALSHVRQRDCELTSQPGWVAQEDRMRWLWPGGSVQYVGPDLPCMEGERHQIEWLRGVMTLLEEGIAGYTALVALGASAAAPFSRILGKRNLIIGYASFTSRGKGSAMGYSLSLWSKIDSLTMPASSTAKGLQDRGKLVPDLPIMVDELQQVLDRGERGKTEASDIIYYLANGVRRVTSSKAQQAVGGERRFGCGMYAAETTIVDGLNAGVQSRVIELGTDPCSSAKVANVLQDSTRHAGAFARAYGESLERLGPAAIATDIEQLADDLRRALPHGSRLRGEDCETVAMVCLGLKRLSEVLGLGDLATCVDGPVEGQDGHPRGLCGWLLDQLEGQRSAQLDKETASLLKVSGHVLSSSGWAKHGYGKPVAGTDEKQQGWACRGKDGFLAFRRSLIRPIAGEDDESDRDEELEILGLEINTDTPSIQQLMDAYGGEQRVLSSWKAKGWLITDGAHLRPKKRFGGKLVGRVARLAPAALEKINIKQEVVPNETA